MVHSGSICDAHASVLVAFREQLSWLQKANAKANGRVPVQKASAKSHLEAYNWKYAVHVWCPNADRLKNTSKATTGNKENP